MIKSELGTGHAQHLTNKKKEKRKVMSPTELIIYFGYTFVTIVNIQHKMELIMDIDLRMRHGSRIYIHIYRKTATQQMILRKATPPTKMTGTAAPI